MTSLDEYKADFASHPIAGMTAIGNKEFSAPLFTQLTPMLWMGGTPAPLRRLPDIFEAVLNLYPWERYEVPDGVDYREERLYDSLDGVAREQAYELAAWAYKRSRTKVTLVHCQAGLNRSGLISGLVLHLGGYSVDDAIALMRRERCDAVLVNPTFESFLRAQDDAA